MQRLQSGHADYLQIVGGSCESGLKRGPFVDRYCGQALDCATAVSDTITAGSTGTICSNRVFRFFFRIAGFALPLTTLRLGQIVVLKRQISA